MHTTMSTAADSFAIDQEGLRAFLIQARLSEWLVEKTLAWLEKEDVESASDHLALAELNGLAAILPALTVQKLLASVRVGGMPAGQAGGGAGGEEEEEKVAEEMGGGGRVGANAGTSAPPTAGCAGTSAAAATIGPSVRCAGTSAAAATIGPCCAEEKEEEEEAPAPATRGVIPADDFDTSVGIVRRSPVNELPKLVGACNFGNLPPMVALPEACRGESIMAVRKMGWVSEIM